MPSPFDEEALMDNLDGDIEFLEETIVMLDQDGPALLSEIRTAAASHDAAALVKPAHALKGMLSNFCAEPAETAARELEMMSREERLADVEVAVERVVKETARLLEALHQFLKMRKE
jgi:HPt (histidine-containing phosphotransfer) domain-containing protein